MLWDIIRDWFVMYVWGGFSSTGQIFGGQFGGVVSSNTYNYWNETYTSDIFVPINVVYGGGDEICNYMCLGDWLSTTSTIIVLVAMCLFLFAVVRYLFRLTAGLIRGH